MVLCNMLEYEGFKMNIQKFRKICIALLMAIKCNQDLEMCHSKKRFVYIFIIEKTTHVDCTHSNDPLVLEVGCLFSESHFIIPNSLYFPNSLESIIRYLI